MQKKPELKPITVEATLVCKQSTKLIAMDVKGYFYIWHLKPSKPLGFKVEEGDLVYVHADERTRDVFHIHPKNGHEPEGGASQEDL